MNSNTILTLSDELLERYRSSIPRKAFEQFVEDITTGPAATAAPKFDVSLLCRASFPAELEDDGGRCIVEVTVYRLNAVAVHTFLLDGPEPLRRHLGIPETDTYITKHDIDDLVEVVTDRYPNATEEAIERIAEAASNMKLSPEAVQRILDAFDRITETIKALYEWAAQAIRTLADFFTETLGDFMLRRAPPKWRHYALHAKRARVRKKYRNRIRRAFFAALASEGGGSS